MYIKHITFYSCFLKIQSVELTSITFNVYLCVHCLIEKNVVVCYLFESDSTEVILIWNQFVFEVTLNELQREARASAVNIKEIH